MSRMIVTNLHQTDTACSWLVCHSATVGGTVRGNTVQIVSTYPASPEARPPSFFGEASRAFPQHGWRSAYSLRETLSTYWTSGCLPREWRPCWSGGRDAWQGFSRETGLSDPSTATRRRGRSITTTTCHQFNSDGPTTVSQIPISANLSVSGYEYNSFRLPYFTIVPFHDVEYNGF